MLTKSMYENVFNLNFKLIIKYRTFCLNSCSSSLVNESALAIRGIRFTCANAIDELANDEKECHVLDCFENSTLSCSLFIVSMSMALQVSILRTRIWLVVKNWILKIYLGFT